MTKTTKTIRTKAAAAAIALTLGISGAFALATPATAYANDGLPSTYYATTAPQAKHYEGEPVTIGEDWQQPVYAEWHRGDSGKWWAMFYTYNYTKVYAEPAPAGCGWAFHAYDKQGNFVTIYRCEESSSYGLYGSEGVSSHWSNNEGTMWF